MEQGLAVLLVGGEEGGAVGGCRPSCAAPARAHSDEKKGDAPRPHIAPGRSELLMSRTIFQEPSVCRCHTVRYLPLSLMSAPVLGCSVHSYVPCSMANAPETITSRVARRTSVIANCPKNPAKPALTAARPCQAGQFGAMTMASSVYI